MLGGRQTEQPNVVQAPTARPAIHFLGLGLSPVRQVCPVPRKMIPMAAANHWPSTSPLPPRRSRAQTGPATSSPRATHVAKPVRADARWRSHNVTWNAPLAYPARNSEAGKKESMGRRLSQLCPPYATPSSNSSLDYRRSDARKAENGFATSGGVSKS